MIFEKPLRRSQSVTYTLPRSCNHSWSRFVKFLKILNWTGLSALIH
ncbi:unnamed protein product [Strongylus vulgaris]|uniref:Uncharacterized protein n=1 Tax=Strongylus vulgaris TaxID=40348 RepID=A0A3P7L1H5_STRVU|nr:unnamed protein product [Strongylus vulgaris]